MSIFERLYASEIYFVLASIRDRGYVVKLGDSINGFLESATCETLSEAELWLSEAACRHYPESPFAQTPRTWCERLGSR